MQHTTYLVDEVSIKLIMVLHVDRQTGRQGDTEYRGVCWSAADMTIPATIPPLLAQGAMQICRTYASQVHRTGHRIAARISCAAHLDHCLQALGHEPAELALDCQHQGVAVLQRQAHSRQTLVSTMYLAAYCWHCMTMVSADAKPI
jgi:hypothetical protein